jgi:hypothetical protein
MVVEPKALPVTGMGLGVAEMLAPSVLAGAAADIFDDPFTPLGKKRRTTHADRRSLTACGEAALWYEARWSTDCDAGRPLVTI